MKILGFESNEGLRLGVVEGDQVVDLQAVDPKLPVNLADVLKANNGDLKGDSEVNAARRKAIRDLLYRNES